MSRREVIREIVNREMKKQGLSEEEVVGDDKRLHDAACHHFGTWDTALRYAGVNVFAPHLLKSYSREDVIKKVRHLCTEMHNLTGKSVQQNDSPLHRAALRHFGTWRKTLMASGINPHTVNRTVESQQLNRARVIAYLQERNRHNRSLAWSDICYENRPVVLAIERFFVKLDLALEAADIPVDAAAQKASDTVVPFRDHRHDYHCDEVIRGIRIRCKDRCNMTSARNQELVPELYNAACQYFGSWEEAIVAAGINPARVFQNVSEGPDKQGVIRAIQERHRQGLSIRRSKVMFNDRLLAMSAQRHFGSWSKAVQAAGVTSDVPIENNEPDVGAEDASG